MKRSMILGFSFKIGINWFIKEKLLELVIIWDVNEALKRVIVGHAWRFSASGALDL